MDRFTLGIVGGVVALVAAGLILAVAFRDRTPAPDLTTPNGVVLAYALAEQRGDPAAAWDLLAPATQASGDHDRFLARAGSTDRDYLSTESEQLDADGGASVVLVRTSPGSGGLFSASYSVRTTVRLVRTPAGWRISVPPDDYLFTTAARS